MEETSIEKSAYQYLIQLLAKQDYSEHKLRLKLKQRSYEEDEIDEAIELIKQKKFLREDYYAEGRIKALIRKGHGKQYIQNMLELEELDSWTDLIDKIFNEYQVSEIDQVRQLVEKKTQFIDMDSMNYTEKLKLKAKLFRFLASKGHPKDLISSTIDHCINLK